MRTSTNLISLFLVYLIVSTASTSYALPPSRIGYTIQAGAFKDASNAERFAKKLNRMNLDAVFYENERSLYSVTFGNFATWAEADKTAWQLKRKRIIEAFCIAEPRKKGVTFRNVSTSATKKVSHSNSAEQGRLAALTAERFVGIQYHWGGNNVIEGLDCSGFVKSVYYLMGLNIPRTAREQFNDGTAIGSNSIREGDLLFFGKGVRKVSHVGMYIGNDRFVHAPRRGQPIQVTSLKDERYLLRFVGAKRYF